MATTNKSKSVTTKEQRDFAAGSIRKLFQRIVTESSYSRSAAVNAVPVSREYMEELYHDGRLVPLAKVNLNRREAFDTRLDLDDADMPVLFVTQAYELPGSELRKLRAKRERKEQEFKRHGEKFDNIMQRVMLKATPDELFDLVEEARQYVHSAEEHHDDAE